jgi:uncharacterized delta-60 repeat protein
VRVPIVLVALAGCGRLGFDPTAGGPDATYNEPTGTLDPSFGTDGVTITSGPENGLEHFAVVPRTGGGYLAVGTHGGGGMPSQMSLVAYTAAGLSDVAFGTGGFVEIGATNRDYGYGAARLDASRIAICGDGNDGGGTGDDFTLAVVDENGVSDPAFAAAGFARIDIGGDGREDTANAVTTAGSTIVTCGVGGYDLADSGFVLVGMDAVGAPAASWGAGGEVEANFSGGVDGCVHVAADTDRIVGAGRSGGGLVVAAFSAATGVLDSAFAGDGTFTAAGSALGVAISSGEVVTVGTRGGEALVVRLASDGTPRAGFGSGGELVIPGILELRRALVQPDGKLVVVGSGSGDGIVARLLDDGALDPSFGVAGISRITVGNDLRLHDALLDPDGAIVVVGIQSSSPLTGVIARLR